MVRPTDRGPGEAATATLTGAVAAAERLAAVEDPDATSVTAVEPAARHRAEPPTLVPATRVDRFLILEKLGEGGMGAVYAAYDTLLDRKVAMKVVRPDRRSAVGGVPPRERLLREAQAMARLRHPNVVAVLDLEEKSRRLVLELAAGGTLRDLLRERGARTLRRGIERHVQILSALAAAHRRGVVHRDLKPGNLMFRRDPDQAGVEIMLGDFGVAHLPDAHGATGAEASRGKPAGEAVGTLAYMSPDQRRGLPPVPADDLYAAAVVLYEMLTGRHPWSREQLMAGARAADDFRLPAATVAGVDPELARAVDAHLAQLGAVDAAARPTTAEAVAAANALRAHAIAIDAA